MTSIEPIWIGYGYDVNKVRKALTGGFWPTLSHQILPNEKNALWVKEPIGIYENPDDSKLPVRFVGNVLTNHGFEFDGSKIMRDGVEFGYGTAIVPTRLDAKKVFAEINALIHAAAKGKTFQTKRGIEKGEFENFTI